MAETTAEHLAAHLARLDRAGLVRMLMDAPCSFRMDFTAEFLDAMSDSELRHVVIAAYLQASRHPEA